MTTLDGKTFSLAAILSLTTGILMSDFGELHALIEHLEGGPVWTHEMASRERLEGWRLELGHRLFDNQYHVIAAKTTIVVPASTARAEEARYD